MLLTDAKHAGAGLFAALERDRAKSFESRSVELLRGENDGVRADCACHAAQRRDIRSERDLDDAITMRARDLREVRAPDLVSAAPDAHERGLTGEQDVGAVEEPRRRDAAAKRDVDSGELGRHAIHLDAARHRSRTHENGAALEDDRCVGHCRTVRIVAVGLDRVHVDTEVPQRAQQHLVLFGRTRVDRTGLSRKRDRALDTRRRPHRDGGAHRSRRRPDQAGAEINGGLGHSAEVRTPAEQGLREREERRCVLRRRKAGAQVRR